uniref:Uncharacterized protein n=1 Tax=Ditylenchus dipsaci TaxID=166011 RepID=A0A915CWY1_9BILA
MLQAINSFPPGILVFPMLYHYFQTQPLPLSKFLIDALLKPLRSTHSKGRLYALSKLEQSALCRRQPAVVDVKLNGGQTSVAEADPWTTAEEFAQKFFDIVESATHPDERKSSLNSAMLAAKHAGNSYLNGVDKSMKQSGISSSEFDSQAFQENNNNNPKLRRFAHPAPIDGNDSKETLNGNKPYASINALSPRRQQNPNCMSRITEEDYSMAGSRENTLQRPSRDYPRLINMMTGYFPSNRMNHRTMTGCPRQDTTRCCLP